MKLREMAEKRYPPNWAQGIDLNSTPREAWILGVEEGLELAAQAVMSATPEGYQLGKPMYRGEWAFVAEQAIRALGGDDEQK